MGLNMQMSRKSAEFIITAGQVTIAGKVVTNPSLKLDLNDDKNDLKSIKVAGRLLRFNTAETTTNKNQSTNTLESKSNASSSSSSSSSSTANNNILLPKTKTRVWIAHKLKGELVSEHDPLGRASLIERLYRGGVGKIKNKSKNGHQKQSTRMHLKPIGRLDMTTEGLILITNDGLYAREMTLPSNAIQRTYRVRVHGRITQQKLNTIRNGIMIDDTFYKGMKVHLELNKSSTRAKGGNTNSWLQVTCTQGKNRMIRKVLDHLGLQVTRLIRTSFGDYDLNTIPPGLAIEVPVKALEKQKRRGLLHFKKKNSGGRKDAKNSATSETQPVEWIRHL
jgi:23S rRNA pseudouridine2605 synthase